MELSEIVADPRGGVRPELSNILSNSPLGAEGAGGGGAIGLEIGSATVASGTGPESCSKGVRRGGFADPAAGAGAFGIDNRCGMATVASSDGSGFSCRDTNRVASPSGAGLGGAGGGATGFGPGTIAFMGCVRSAAGAGGMTGFWDEGAGAKFPNPASPRANIRVNSPPEESSVDDAGVGASGFAAGGGGAGAALGGATGAADILAGAAGAPVATGKASLAKNICVKLPGGLGSGAGVVGVGLDLKGKSSAPDVGAGVDLNGKSSAPAAGLSGLEPGPKGKSAAEERPEGPGAPGPSCASTSLAKNILVNSPLSLA